MEKYKDALMHDLVKYREEARYNNQCLIFLINEDHIVSDGTIDLIARLHHWPSDLDTI